MLQLKVVINDCDITSKATRSLSPAFKSQGTWLPCLNALSIQDDNRPPFEETQHASACKVISNEMPFCRWVRRTSEDTSIPKRVEREASHPKNVAGVRLSASTSLSVQAQWRPNILFLVRISIAQHHRHTEACLLHWVSAAGTEGPTHLTPTP